MESSKWCHLRLTDATHKLNLTLIYNNFCYQCHHLYWENDGLVLQALVALVAITSRKKIVEYNNCRESHRYGEHGFVVTTAQQGNVCPYNCGNTPCWCHYSQ